MKCEQQSTKQTTLTGDSLYSDISGIFNIKIQNTRNYHQKGLNVLQQLCMYVFIFYLISSSNIETQTSLPDNLDNFLVSIG